MSEPVSHSELQQELNGGAIEPLLPVEKDLISICLLTGLFLLGMLFIVNRFFPLTH